MDSSTPRRVEHIRTDKGEVPVYTTAIVEQPWSAYSAVDHQTWAQLFARQSALLPGLACAAFLDGLVRLGLSPDRIPRFEDLNRELQRRTGWTLIGVEGLLPELDFFEHLAARRFPVTWWIRRPEQIDYLSEPDLFHDLYGHVPLLANPVFADYMQAYGEGGVKAARNSPESLQFLTRLYWYTVEFGLIREAGGLRIYGAGILSSKTESLYAVQSPAPNRIGFDLLRVMRTRYRIDTFQQTYFVIRDFEQLFAATEPDFTPYYAELAHLPALPARVVLASDEVVQRGNGEGWVHSGDV